VASRSGENGIEAITSATSEAFDRWLHNPYDCQTAIGV